MKLHDILEARYVGHKDEGWLYDAITIADGNIERAKKTYKHGPTLQAETEFWQEYKQWLRNNQSTLQAWYEQIKADRDTFIEHSMDLFKGSEQDRKKISGKAWSDAQRMRQAEIWSGNIDQHDYKTYWKLIDDASKAEHDFAIMVSNTMIDRLGGLRDENR